MRKSGIAAFAFLISLVGLILVKKETLLKRDSHFANINRLLYMFVSQCNLEQVEEATDTFLEIQQEWERKDVLFSGLPKNKSNYCPSDSLKRLRELLHVLARNRSNELVKTKINTEVKLINARIDQIKFDK